MRLFCFSAKTHYSISISGYLLLPYPTTIFIDYAFIFYGVESVFYAFNLFSPFMAGARTTGLFAVVVVAFEIH